MTGRGPIRTGGNVRREMERHLVRLWNELHELAVVARSTLGVDPPLLHFPVLDDLPVLPYPGVNQSSGTPDRVLDTRCRTCPVDPGQ